MRSLTIPRIASAAIIAVFFGLFSGCAALESLGDYVNENPQSVNIIARQAVARYAAAGDTIEIEQARAAKAQKVLTKALLYLSENDETTVSQFLFTVDSLIDWDGLTTEDQILVMDIMNIVEGRLRENIGDTLSESSKIGLRTLIQTMISAAQIYLRA